MVCRQIRNLVLVLIISLLPVVSSAQDKSADEEWYKKNFPEEWVLVGSADGASMYYNKASILRAGDYLTLDTRIVFDSPRQMVSDSPIKAKFIEDTLGINCADNTYKKVRFSVWADNGELIGRQNTDRELGSFDADGTSFISIMAKRVCSQDK